MPRVRLVELTDHGSRALIWMASGRVGMDKPLIRNPDDENSDTEEENWHAHPLHRGRAAASQAQDIAPTGKQMALEKP